MEVHANVNWPKLGVIFNIFVEGDKVAAAEILNDVVWHLLEPHQVRQGGSGRWQGLGIRFLCRGQRSIGWLMQRFASSQRNQRKGLGRCQSVFGVDVAWRQHKQLCGGLRVLIVSDTGWVQLFLNSREDEVSVKGDGERVVGLLEGSMKVIAISRVLGTRIGLAESGIVSQQKAELMPLIDVGLACASGRFRLWTWCHHFSVQFLNVPIGQQLESADDVMA
jgi:hypothetical protein